MEEAVKPRKLKLPIVVNVVVGERGSGKSSCIVSWLAQKPADEVWCVVENENGITPDVTKLEGVHVRRLGGSCMCCAQAVSVRG